MGAEQLRLATPPGRGETAGAPHPPTPEQARAIEARERDVLLDAGAGTGKTRVLVDRYCEAAIGDGAGVEGIVAFTFTERAAAELRGRIRSELARRAAHEGDADTAVELARLARDSEGAWISTIHGFCRRLLASHPVALGLDPRFRVLDQPEADRIALRAFDEALEELLAGADPERSRLVAAIGLRDLRAMVRTAHDELRIQGHREPALPRPPEFDLEAALRALSAAARAALDETEGGRGGAASLELLRTAATLEAASPPPAAELEELELRSKARAFSGAACAAYREAWQLARRVAVERESAGLYDHLAELVRLFGVRFAALKDERSGLDFIDLELEAVRLLSERPRIADVYRERLRHVMVDEFQDTNRLQVELIELLRGPGTRLFAVGDEFQSIYGFRHADLRVFERESRRIDAMPDERAELMRLSGNFRSTPDVVAAANRIGDAILGDFRPLTVGAARPGSEDPGVELLLTPGGEAWRDEALGIRLPGDHPSAPDRVAEARLLAARLRALHADHGVPLGDMVVLLRAFTHVAAFEEELERARLRPYVVGGRGYWSQQQVEDARRLLGAVANPLDDLSLLGALAAPTCGVRPDTLWLLRQAARRDETRHLWPSVERRFGPAAESDDDAGVPPDDAERLRRFCERLAELREHGPRLALEELVQRAITSTGYDLAVLTMSEGPRRYANLRKLMRLAREYEAAEGRDLRGFLDYLEERSAREDPEGEAATEAEEHPGVRLMTVHAAKGLEFPVVAVADLGRRLLHGGRGPGVRIDDDPGAERDPGDQPGAPRVGIRLGRFGAKAVGLFEYDELAAEADAADAAESCRLAYVAATRARDRLLLSGCYDANALARPVPEQGLKPGTPISERLMRALGLDDGESATIAVPAAEPRPGLDLAPGPGRIAVRFNRPDPDAFASLASGRPPVETPTPEPGRPPLADRGPAGEPASHRLSYSALAAFGSCGYRFYAERVLGLSGPERDDGSAGGEGPGRARRYGFGSAVHAMLEWSARHRWREPPERVCEELLRRERLTAVPAELDRARSMVAAWLGSELRAELDGPGVSLRAEMPFLLPVNGAIVRGTIDLLAQTPDGPVVVDYKTDSLAEATPGELVERYGVQRTIYALAAGARAPDRVRTAYAFLDSGGGVVVRDLDRADLGIARQELERLVSAVSEGRFEVTSEPHAALCWDCPARARLCTHPLEETGRRR